MEQHDPHQPEAVEQRREDDKTQRKLSRDTEKADIKWLMKSKRGRRIMMRLLDAAGVFKTSFSTDALVMAFNEGNRNTGLRWLEIIHTHCPDLYQVMLTERSNERRAEHGESGN